MRYSLVSIAVAVALGLGIAGWRSHQVNLDRAALLASRLLAEAEAQPFSELGSRGPVSQNVAGLALTASSEVSAVPGEPLLKDVRVRVEWTQLGIRLHADYSVRLVDRG